ncbi:MAG TPA: hypothetical protein VGH19_11310 [Verrucomicrobiae bacterium]
MQSQSAPRFLLTVCLIAGLGAHWAEAGEKILFSSGKDKDAKKANLAVQQAKPALETLDFNRMGGRGSKAEEMAPTELPPSMRPREVVDLQKKKKDGKDWLSTEKDEADDTDSQDHKTRSNTKDKSKEKDLAEKKDWDERRENKRDRFDQKQNDPFRRENRQENLSPFSNGSSTNRVLFGNSTRPENQPFRAEHAPGSPIREHGLPPSAGFNSSAESSKASALEKLGFTRPQTGNLGTGFNGNNGSPGLGISQNTPRATAGPLGTLERASTSANNVPGGMAPRNSSLTPNLAPDPSRPDLFQQNGQLRQEERPISVRRPAILPTPQRQF